MSMGFLSEKELPTKILLLKLAKMETSAESIVQSGCAGISVILNAILILLILFKSPKSLGLYKYLMAYISIFETLYSIMDFVLQPVIITLRGGYILCRYTSLSRNQGFMTLVLYVAFFGFSLAIFGIHFIYRYGVVNKQFFKKYLNGWRVYVLFVIPLLYSAWWAASCQLFFHFTPDSDEYLRKTLLSEYDLLVEKLSYVSVIFYFTDSKGVVRMNQSSFVGNATWWATLISSVFCVFYFGMRCYFRISKAIGVNSMLSITTRNLQQQLFQALVAQTAIPLILIYIPFGFINIFPLLNIDIGSFSSYIIYTIALYPAIDPLPNILIIKCYRKQVTKIAASIINQFAKVGNFLANRSQESIDATRRS